MAHIKFALVICAVIMLASCSSSVSDQPKAGVMKKVKKAHSMKVPCTSIKDPRCR